MKPSKKKLKLMSEGFTASWVLSLNESQTNLMYDRLFESKGITNEQTAPGPQPKVTTKTVKQIELPQGGKTNIKGSYSVSNQGGKTVVTQETNEGELEEKAVSKKQQEFFGVVRSMQKGETPKKGKPEKSLKKCQTKMLKILHQLNIKVYLKKLKKLKQMKLSILI